LVDCLNNFTADSTAAHVDGTAARRQWIEFLSVY